MSIYDILDARHQTHGTFCEVADLSVGLRHMILSALSEQQKTLPCDQEEALIHICTKIARIVNGTTNADNWHDIAGYATLVADRLEGKSR